MRYSLWILGLSLVLVLSACGGEGTGGTPGGGETGGGETGGGDETGGETPDGPSNFSVEVADDVSWAAFQDGDGNWEPLETGTTELNVSDEAFGLVYVCEGEEGTTSVNLSYGALESYTSAPERFFSDLECEEAIPSPPPYLTLSGDVAGVEADEGGNVSYGLSSDVFYNQSDEPKLSYTLDTVLAGSADLIATNGPVTFSEAEGPPARGVIRRGEAVNSDTTLDLDFEEGVALESHQVDVTNLNILDESFVGSVLLTSGGGTVHPGLANKSVQSEVGLDASLSFAYASFPVAMGDSYTVNVTTSPDGDETGCTRTSGRTLETPQDVNIALLECFEIGVDVTATSPYVRPTATVSDTVDVSAATSGRYVYAQLDSLVDVVVTFFGSERTGEFTDYQLPDFSSVAGWDNSWGLTTGQTIRYTSTFNFGADAFRTSEVTTDEASIKEGDIVAVRGTVSP